MKMTSLACDEKHSTFNKKFSKKEDLRFRMNNDLKFYSYKIS